MRRVKFLSNWVAARCRETDDNSHGVCKNMKLLLLSWVRARLSRFRFSTFWSQPQLFLSQAISISIFIYITHTDYPKKIYFPTAILSFFISDNTQWDFFTINPQSSEILWPLGNHQDHFRELVIHQLFHYYRYFEHFFHLLCFALLFVFHTRRKQQNPSIANDVFQVTNQEQLGNAGRMKEQKCWENPG